MATGSAGPYTLEELWRVDFGPDALVWRDGMPDWERADSIADLRTIRSSAVRPAQRSEAAGSHARFR